MKKLYHDCVFSYVYTLKDNQTYQVKNTHNQNIATKKRLRDYHTDHTTTFLLQHQIRCEYLCSKKTVLNLV